MKQPAKTLFKRSYFPGMISLICLPLLCVGYFAHVTGFKQLAMMNVNWLNDTSIKSWNLNRKDKIDIKKFKNYPSFIINGDASNNEKVLNKLKYLCKEITRKKEFGKGVAINFTDESKYRDLVNIIDFGYSLKEISFMLYKDKVFFTLVKPYKAESIGNLDNDMVFNCGTRDSYSLISDFLLLMTNKAKHYSKEFWPSITAFLLMIFFSIRSQRKLAV
jgi:hypothetical protein